MSYIEMWVYNSKILRLDIFETITKFQSEDKNFTLDNREQLRELFKKFNLVLSNSHLRQFYQTYSVGPKRFNENLELEGEEKKDEEKKDEK